MKPSAPFDSPQLMESMDQYGMQLALEEAKKGYKEGGIPIGSVLLYKDSNNDTMIVGSGRNERVQKGSNIIHGEMAAIEGVGRSRTKLFKLSTIYTTLSPCSMCTGAILLYKIPRIVIGENKNWKGDEDLLRSRGVEVIVANNVECETMMAKFIKENPELWREDIGEAYA